MHTHTYTLAVCFSKTDVGITQFFSFFFLLLSFVRMSEVKKEDTPEEAAAAATITLKVVDSEGSEVTFKIKRTTPLRKLMEAYCQRHSLNINAVRFLYDGDRITPDATPDLLKMEDGDLIDIAVQQIGGKK